MKPKETVNEGDVIIRIKRAHQAGSMGRIWPVYQYELEKRALHSTHIKDLRLG